MGIFAFMVMGIILGFIARAIVPRSMGVGLIAACLLGMAGAMIGSTVGSLLGGDSRYFELGVPEVLFAVVGSLLFLGLVSRANSRRAHA